MARAGADVARHVAVEDARGHCLGKPDAVGLHRCLEEEKNVRGNLYSFLVM